MTMDYFGVRSAEGLGCATNKPQAGYAKIYAFNGVEYIQREYLNDPYRVLDRWNVLLTHSIGGDKKVVANTMRVIGPNEACSVTYLCIGGCSNQLIAERLKKYIQTKFVRFLMSLAISGQSISRERMLVRTKQVKVESIHTAKYSREESVMVCISFIERKQRKSGIHINPHQVQQVAQRMHPQRCQISREYRREASSVL